MQLGLKAPGLPKFLPVLGGAHFMGKFLAQRFVTAKVQTTEAPPCQRVPNSSARFGVIHALTTTPVV